ncbi:unnamed protein product [Larinioides sclopetarius]|uniref:Protein argonaute N-terminal domain-containing protein n=1 Tax=Larinioides sclopetarius TaxID=280406 RepID=A0AAV2BYP5_9ARAC
MLALPDLSNVSERKIIDNLDEEGSDAEEDLPKPEGEDSGFAPRPADGQADDPVEINQPIHLCTPGSLSTWRNNENDHSSVEIGQVFPVIGEAGSPSAAVFEAPVSESGREAPKPAGDVFQLGMELMHKFVFSPVLPAKPIQGKRGKPIRMISNCFNFVAPKGFVYHYDVHIVSKGHSVTRDPAIAAAATSSAMRGEEVNIKCPERNIKIINLMMNSNENFRGRHPAYDGMKNLYSREPLTIGEELKCNVVLEDDDNAASPDDLRGRSETFDVIIKPVQKPDTPGCGISMDTLHALYASKDTSVPQETVMALETILRDGPCKSFIPIEHSFYFPPAPPLGGGLDIWFGYEQSLQMMSLQSQMIYEEGARPLTSS